MCSFEWCALLEVYSFIEGIITKAKTCLQVNALLRHHIQKGLQELHGLTNDDGIIVGGVWLLWRPLPFLVDAAL